MIDGKGRFRYNRGMLPNDPYMLLSAVNMKLRDGVSLDDLCADENVSEEELFRKLEAIGYFYDEERRTFVAK